MRSYRPDATDAAACVCGCGAEAHVHYRPGTDCGRCGNSVCEVYRSTAAPQWRDPQLSPQEAVWQEEGYPEPPPAWWRTRGDETRAG